MLASNTSHCHPANGIFDANILLPDAISPSLYRYLVWISVKQRRPWAWSSACIDYIICAVPRPWTDCCHKINSEGLLWHSSTPENYLPYGRLSLLVILYTTKNFFRRSLFLYSLCPNLKGIKRCKFRSSMIGQNWSAVRKNKGGHRDAFLNERHEAPHVFRGLLSRPCATKPQAKQETRSVLCHSLVVDLTSEQSRTLPLQWWVWAAAVDLHWGVLSMK